MKNKLYFVLGVLLFFIVACKDDSSKICFQELQDEFKGAIGFTGAFESPFYVWPKFYNVGSMELNMRVYWSLGETLSYLPQKSKLKFLSQRKDKKIPRDLLQGIKDIDFITDDSVSNETVILMSEPFFIDENRFLFSITKRGEPRDLFWFFFIEEKVDKKEYKVFAVYDWQKDMLYDVIHL